MLRWSLRLGSLLGVPVYLHWTFLVLIVWFMAGPLMSGSPDAMAASLRTGGFILAIFGCIVLHEMGHALAARRYGIGTRNITLLPFGGVASLERMPEKPAQELVVALAGPAVNLAIAAIIIPAVLATDGAAAFTPPAGGGPGPGSVVFHRAHFLASLGVVNAMLVVFNMIPALPMDGGRVLRALLAMATDRTRATRVAAAVGQCVAIGFVILGLFAGHVFLMLIGVFVFLGAGAEAQAEKVRSALEGLPVHAAMLTRFRSLRASHSLRHAADELLAGSQQDFPVLADNAAADHDEAPRAADLVGVLTRVDLVRAMAGGSLDAAVSTVARPPCPMVGEHEGLQDALERARTPQDRAAASGTGECPIVAVVRPYPPDGARSRIVGLVTPDNLTELIMLRAALKDAAHTDGRPPF